MAKFCTKCGKPLEEGQVCSCQLSQGFVQSQSQQNQPQQSIISQTTGIQNQQGQPQPSIQQGQPQPSIEQGQPQPNVQQGQPQNAQQPQEQINQQVQYQQFQYQQAQYGQYQQTQQQNNQQYQGQPMNQAQFQQQFNQAKQSSSVFLTKVFNAFKKILRNPASEGAKFAASEDIVTAFGLFGLQAICSGIFALAIISKINSGILSMYNSFEADGVSEYKFSGVRAFFVTIVISIILSCILAGILLGINLIMKRKVTYKAMLCVAASRSAALVPVTIIAIILYYINVNFGISLFCLGNLVGLSYIMYVFPVASFEERNKVPALVSIAYIVFVFVAVFVFYKCIQFYIPDTYKEAWDTFSNAIHNPSDIYNSFLGY